MRLVEFYNPENDKSVPRDFDDTRKGRLTLEALNKLRKYRELKKAENIEQEQIKSDVQNSEQCVYEVHAPIVVGFSVSCGSENRLY